MNRRSAPSSVKCVTAALVDVCDRAGGNTQTAHSSDKMHPDTPKADPVCAGPAFAISWGLLHHRVDEVLVVLDPGVDAGVEVILVILEHDLFKVGQGFVVHLERLDRFGDLSLIHISEPTRRTPYLVCR